MFRFPTDEEKRESWLQKILREKREPEQRKCLYLCEKHFQPSEFEHRDNHRKTANEGTLQQREKLSVEVVPSIWPNLPARLTKKSPLPRPRSSASNEVREQKGKGYHQAGTGADKDRDQFTSLEELETKLVKTM